MLVWLRSRQRSKRRISRLPLLATRIETLLKCPGVFLSCVNIMPHLLLRALYHQQQQEEESRQRWTMLSEVKAKDPGVIIALSLPLRQVIYVEKLCNVSSVIIRRHRHV